MYSIVESGKSLTALKKCSFSELGFGERGF